MVQFWFNGSMEDPAQICLEVGLSAVLMGRAFMWRNVPLLNCVLLYTYDKDQRRKYILPIIFELSENNQYFFFPEPVRMSCGIDVFSKSVYIHPILSLVSGDIFIFYVDNKIMLVLTYNIFK